jgi:3'-5' exoribonuclease
MNVLESIEYLRLTARKFEVESLCEVILNDERFPIWSGSGKPMQHHYGKGGLAIHTAEVVKLCLANNESLGDFPMIDARQMFLAAFFHDVGKMWDYAPDDNPKLENPDYQNWVGTSHKRHIHHISRSALVWQESITAYCKKYLNGKPKWLTDTYIDEVLHAILAHHGLRQWGSPVMPNTRLAWMLHLCDGISARMNDADKWDQTKC